MADISPIDYSLHVATPFASALAGYQAGAAIRDDQANQVALQAKQQAAQQQQQLLTGLANNPNATGADYARVMTLIPSVAEPLQKAWGALSAEQSQTHLSDLSQWSSAIKNGQPQYAVDAMNARADAMEKTQGPTPQSQALRANAGVVAAHPQFGLGLMTAQLAAHPDGTKVATTLASLGGEDRAEAQAPADLAKKNADALKAGVDATVANATVPAQIEKPTLENQKTVSDITTAASRLGLDRDKLTTDTQLALQEMKLKYGQVPEYVASGINSATTEAVASDQSATKMSDLANKLDAEGGGYGGLSTAGEWIKKVTGNQNEMTRLRSEYNRIVTPASMAAYKQVASGSTSDKDIETAMLGVPSDTADAGTMASFLRGTAKLQRYNAVLSNAKAEWLGSVQNLGKAKTDIEIDGVKVPAGMSFKQFTDAYVPRKLAEKTNDAVIKSSSYAQFAHPAQPAPTAPVPYSAATD